MEGEGCADKPLRKRILLILLIGPTMLLKINGNFSDPTMLQKNKVLVFAIDKSCHPQALKRSGEESAGTGDVGWAEPQGLTARS